MTQEQLVKISGVGISQIRRYEADKSAPSLDATIRLVKAIGVSIDEMVFDKTTAIASNKITDRLAQGAKDYSQDDIDKVSDEAVALVRKKNYTRH